MTLAEQVAIVPEGGKARRVYLSLRGAILSGDYAEGEALPGEQRLAESFAVSRVTVRRALGGLAADGLIERRAGSGTRVRAPGAAPISAGLAELMPGLAEMERRTTARLVSFAYAPAAPQIAREMGLEDGAEVQVAVRVRLLDGRPFSHLTTHVPQDVARTYSEAELATQPLFRLIERGGAPIEGAVQQVTAALAAPEIAAALEVEIGSATLALTRLVHGAGGRVVERLAAIYRPDLFRLEMRLSRVGRGAERRWAPILSPLMGGEG